MQDQDITVVTTHGEYVFVGRHIPIMEEAKWRHAMCDSAKDKKEFLDELLSDLWKAYEMFKGQEEHDAYTRTLVLEACSMLSKNFLKAEPDNGTTTP